MTHTLTLQSRERLTHDVNRFVFDKPAGYDFTPGQATDLALDRDGWREEKRPFTFTSLPQEDRLEFTIKSYPEHGGVTEQLATLEPGETVLIDDPWGAISDEGDGTFIAGGAGVTPFIAILRDKLAQKGSLEGNTLVFSNQTEADIVLRDEFEGMPGLKTFYTVTDEPASDLARGQIDADMLKGLVEDGPAYVSGPDAMIGAMQSALKTIGIPAERIFTEDFG